MALAKSSNRQPFKRGPQQLGGGAPAPVRSANIDQRIPLLPINKSSSKFESYVKDKVLGLRQVPSRTSDSTIGSLEDAIKILQRNKKHPGLEYLRDCTHVFVRPAENDKNSTFSFLTGATNVLNIFDQKNRRIYFVKEMEGDGRRLSVGGTLDIIYCILASDGRELLRIEGNRGRQGHHGVFVVFKKEKFLGKIKQVSGIFSHSCYYSITDETKKEILLIRKQNLQDKRTCCHKMCSKSKKGESRFFDVIMADTKSKISGMGKIARFFPSIPRELDDYLGIECSEALNISERSLLLSSILLVYKPETISAG